MKTWAPEPRCFKIVRFRMNGRKRTIRANVTETEAQNHCSREDTHGEGGFEMAKVYVCPECGCIDVEGTTWLNLNTGAPDGGDPPTDDYWCPRCEKHLSRVCLVDAETGECEFHKGHKVMPVRDWSAGVM